MLNLDLNSSSTVKLDTKNLNVNIFLKNKIGNRNYVKKSMTSCILRLTLAVSSLIRRFLTVILLLESKF